MPQPRRSAATAMPSVATWRVTGWPLALDVDVTHDALRRPRATICASRSVQRRRNRRAVDAGRRLDRPRCGRSRPRRRSPSRTSGTTWRRSGRRGGRDARAGDLPIGTARGAASFQAVEVGGVLAPEPQRGGAVADRDDRRAADAVVRAGQRVRVGAGGGEREEVAALDVARQGRRRRRGRRRTRSAGRRRSTGSSSGPPRADRRARPCTGRRRASGGCCRTSRRRRRPRVRPSPGFAVADPVERDARRCADERRPGSTTASARGGRARRGALRRRRSAAAAVSARRRRLVRVGDPEPAADVERARPSIADVARAAATAARRARRSREVRLGVEDLRPDVRVEPIEPKCRERSRRRDRLRHRGRERRRTSSRLCPVAIASWVSAPTSGTTRSRIGCTIPAAPATASSRRSSSAPSTITSRRRARTASGARRRTCCCRARRCARAGTPARRHASTSPPRRGEQVEPFLDARAGSSRARVNALTA